jgi:hypothetical protein
MEGGVRLENGSVGVVGGRVPVDEGWQGVGDSEAVVHWGLQRREGAW